MTLDTGPCSPWPAYFTCEVSSYSPTATGYAVDMATRTVWALSGRRYGTCAVTLRPCRESCYDRWPSAHPLSIPFSSYGGVPANWDASYWFGSSCGSCAGNCSCGEVPTVKLPSPVNSIVSVKVDGSPLVSGSYRLDNARLLVRTDGQRWPRCNDLTKDDSQTGTWSVTANVGMDVPESGRMAVGQLACEILKAMSGADCQLPSTVQHLVRQGVTFQFPDVSTMLSEGKTGLYLVDLFLATENPNRLSSRGRIYSPDHRAVRRQGS
jgi:hypothetical protein